MAGGRLGGINLVETHHIRNGLVRYADQFRSILESESLPDPDTLEHVFAALTNTKEDLLREKALDVIRHIVQKARLDDKLKNKSAIREMNARDYVGQMTKERLISLLMREFVKYCLGKETPLHPSFWLALKDEAAHKRRPLS